MAMFENHWFSIADLQAHKVSHCNSLWRCICYTEVAHATLKIIVTMKQFYVMPRTGARTHKHTCVQAGKDAVYQQHEADVKSAVCRVMDHQWEGRLRGRGQSWGFIVYATRMPSKLRPSGCTISRLWQDTGYLQMTSSQSTPLSSGRV